jgi:2-oxoglutarate dehydrogenase complex dehydrogenase (E1) component-like enzyme
VAKVTLSPVLHVNADDAEAVVHAMSFALDFRMEFGRDVFIDLLDTENTVITKAMNLVLRSPFYTRRLLQAQESKRYLYGAIAC